MSAKKLRVTNPRRKAEDSPHRDVILLTPGPLTTALSTKRAMLRDWGSREEDFCHLVRKVCGRIEVLAGMPELSAEESSDHRSPDHRSQDYRSPDYRSPDYRSPDYRSHVCVPLAGSGTYALEAAITTLCSPQSRLLVMANGAYGQRLGQIAQALGRPCQVITSAEEMPLRPDDLDRILQADTKLTHVAFVHCETSSGVLNPLQELAEICRRHRRKLIIDAMSTFGALDINLGGMEALALVASSNKCLEGVPGLAFVLVQKKALAESHAHSLVLDLRAQWQFLQSSGQFRFTPPVQVIAALDHALDLLDREGGIAQRAQRYHSHQDILNRGMKDLGFENLIESSARSPIIQSFRVAKGFDFTRFHDLLFASGYAIYPGKMTQVDSFRIGCIGAIKEDDIRSFLQAAQSALEEMKKQK